MGNQALSTDNTSSQLAASQVASTITPSSQTTREPFNWMGTQYSAAQTRADMKDWILLDNQSSVDLFLNPGLVTNINNASETLVLATNAGDLTTNQQATVPAYGKVWYDEEAMTNVFSLAEMMDRHQVTFNSAKENAFIVHTEKGPVKFPRGPENLYYYKPKYRTGTNLVETVDENKSFYTARQHERAKQARTLLHTLGCPTIQDLKAVLRMNAINNCPVTINTVDLAEKIYGKDVASIKGKTTRRKPTPVMNDIVEIPQELMDAQWEVDLCFNIMYVN